jgi:fructokinase
MENATKYHIAGASLVLAGLAYRMIAPKEQAPQHYHLGVETGGTGCKVAIFVSTPGVDMLKRVVVKKFVTENPDVTVNKMVDFVNQFSTSNKCTFSSLGVASFGPICIDQSSLEYGNVTTTPKIAWQHFNLLGKVDNQIQHKAENYRVEFDTDCNILAMFEF